MKPLLLSITKTLRNPQLLLPHTTQRIRFTFTLLALAATESNLAVAQVEYQESDGIYMSMYGVPARTDRFTAAVDAALQLPYIKGIAFYPQWNELQPAADTYDWSDFDHVVKSAISHKKKVILGLQAGVASPEWVLDDYNVKKIEFVHANEDWLGWTTKKKIKYTKNKGTYYVSTAPLPWNNAWYDSYRKGALSAINHRICFLTGIPSVPVSKNPTIAFINVCGPSVSGGTETNLVIDWAKSIDNNPNFVAVFKNALGITDTQTYGTRYEAAWQASINSHLEIFKNLKLGLGLHHDTGGPDTGATTDPNYNTKVTTATNIRNYFIDRHSKSNPSIRGKPHLRNLGLSANTTLWGNLGVLSKSNFVTLVTDQNDSADIGYESGTVARNNWSSLGAIATPEQFYSLLKKGMDHYGRILEIKVPDIIFFQESLIEPVKAYAYGPYVPELKKAARHMQPKTDKIFWTGPSSITDETTITQFEGANRTNWVTIDNTLANSSPISSSVALADKKLVFGLKKQSTPTDKGSYEVSIPTVNYSGLIFDVDAPAITLNRSVSTDTITLNGNIEVAGHYPFITGLTATNFAKVHPESHRINFPISIGTNRTINTGSNASIQLNGIVSGAGGLTKSGSGTLQLSANNAYIGTTQITEGTLEINGNQSFATGEVTVEPTGPNQANLSGTGTIGGNVTIKNGGTLAPGSTAVGSLTLNAKTLTLENGAKLQFRLGTSGTNDQVNGVSTLILTTLNWSDFTFKPVAGFTGGDYTLIDTASTSIPETRIASGLIDSISAEIRLKNGDLVLTSLTPIKIWTGTNGNSYDNNPNWLSGTTPTADETIIFNTPTTGDISTVLEEDESVFGIQVNNTRNTSIRPGLANRTITIGAGGITINAGAGNFNLGRNVNGTNIISLNLLHHQSWLNNGLGTFNLIASSGNREIRLNGKNLKLGGSGLIEINSAIIGPAAGSTTPAGNVIKDGTGTLSLSGTHTYSGTTTVNAGTLNLTGSIAFSNVTVARDAVLNTNNGAITKNVTLSAGGRLVINIPAGTPTASPVLNAGALALTQGDLELKVPQSLEPGKYLVAQSTSPIQYPIGKPIKITGPGVIEETPDKTKLYLTIMGPDSWRPWNKITGKMIEGYDDARNNLHKHAFRLDQFGSVVDSSTLHTDGTISYIRTKDSQANLIYTTQYSTNLTSWNELDKTTNPEEVSNLNTVEDRVTITISKSLQSETRIFFRIKVTSN